MNRIERRLFATFFVCVVVCAVYAQSASQGANTIRPSQAKTNLLIRADVACEFSIDGQHLGWVKPDGVKIVPVGPGDHLVSGVNRRGHKWEKVVTVKDPGQQVVLAECSGPVPPDFRELINKADAGDPKSQFSLAYIYERGAVGVQQDNAEAMYWYRAAAEQGSRSYQSMLAEKYAEGKLVLKNYAEAAKWYRKAAEQKDPRACLELGKLYEGGLGVGADGAEALRLYTIAADAPRPATSDLFSAEQAANLFDTYLRAEAQYRIGYVLFDGTDNVKKDPTKAADWFARAAKLRHSGAQTALAVMYENGRGVGQDYAEALRLYRLAADQGVALAQLLLGGMYRQGEGVNPDPSQAEHWYRKAADQGDATGQYFLGAMYEDGLKASPRASREPHSGTARPPHRATKLRRRHWSAWAFINLPQDTRMRPIVHRSALLGSRVGRACFINNVSA